MTATVRVNPGSTVLGFTLVTALLLVLNVKVQFEVHLIYLMAFCVSYSFY